MNESMNRSKDLNFARSGFYDFSDANSDVKFRCNQHNMARMTELQNKRHRSEDVYYIVDVCHEGEHVYSVVPRSLIKDSCSENFQAYSKVGDHRHVSVSAVVDERQLRSNSVLPQILLECQHLENLFDVGVDMFPDQEQFER